MDNPQRHRRRLLLLVLLVEGGLVGLAWGLGWWLEQPAFRELRWEPRDAAWGLVASLPLLAFLLLCTRWPVGPLAEIKQYAQAIIRPLFAPCTLLDLAVISALAGLGEELLFRGVLQGLLGRWLGLPLGVAATNVLFGLVHLVTPAYAVMAGLMGLYLSGVYLAGGNLLVVVVAHGVYDFLALVYLVRGPLAEA